MCWSLYIKHLLHIGADILPWETFTLLLVALAVYLPEGVSLSSSVQRCTSKANMLRPSAVLCSCKPDRASPLSPWYHREQSLTLTVLFEVRPRWQLSCAVPLLWLLWMVNMLMVIICSKWVLPSRDLPCCSSVLNSCRIRLATPGKDSMLCSWNTKSDVSDSIIQLHQLISRLNSLQNRISYHSPDFSKKLSVRMQETQDKPLIELDGERGP